MPQISNAYGGAADFRGWPVGIRNDRLNLETWAYQDHVEMVTENEVGTDENTYVAVPNE